MKQPSLIALNGEKMSVVQSKKKFLVLTPETPDVVKLLKVTEIQIRNTFQTTYSLN
jgi:hypothetical protein